MSQNHHQITLRGAIFDAATRGIELAHDRLKASFEFAEQARLPGDELKHDLERIGVIAVKLREKEASGGGVIEDLHEAQVRIIKAALELCARTDLAAAKDQEGKIAASAISSLMARAAEIRKFLQEHESKGISWDETLVAWGIPPASGFSFTSIRR